MATEEELIAALTKVFQSRSESVLVGIGDDAAVVKANLTPAALATDMAVEGVHFSRNWSSLYEIGGKVAAANLADIYAMGGNPEYLLVAAAVPHSFTPGEVEELAQGIYDEADSVDAIVVGGDLTRSEKIVIAISVYGAVAQPILRSGAAPGDQILLSKITGDSAAGLELLQRGILDERSAAHRKPDVEYEKARAIASIATAMCDVSDGLVSELNHISRSSGVAMSISTEAFATQSTELARLTRMAEEIGCSPWDLILHGGEDHAFLATIPAATKVPTGFFRIGEVSAGSRVLVDGFIAEHQGFTHFS